MAANVSIPSRSKESTDSKSERKTNIRAPYEKEETDFNLCPFELLWSFGTNSDTPIINLTTKYRTIIAYACSHAIIIYNYKTKNAISLQGHKNTVKTLSTSKDGKWLMSADFEKDCVTVVWDTETGVPISTLFNPHGDKGMTAAKISPNAKYIVTVGNEFHQKVQFWLWTYGKDQPDAFTELTELFSNRIKEIAFNEDCSEEFGLTADYCVAFLKWEQDELKYYIPKILGNVRRYGILNCSCYIPKTQRVLTATTNGYVLVWGAFVERQKNKSKDQSAANNKEKRHIKSVQLEKNSIMVILCHDGRIVTGTSEGRISFYDLDLKILYWCQHKLLDSIRSISFDLSSTLLAPGSAVGEFKLESDEEEDFENEEEMEEYSEIKLGDNINERKMKYIEKIESMKYRDQVPSTMSVHLEETLKNYNKDQQAFTKLPHAPTDVTVEGCLSGIVALIEIPTLKCRFIFQDQNFAITSLDAHPRSNFIVTGNLQGFVSLYDYERHKRIVRRKTPPLPDFNILLDKQAKKGAITYVTCPQSHEKLIAVTALKYSPIGNLLACGLENGALWMLHPLTLEPLDKNPYKHSTESILKLAFTECEEYMAYADNALVVAVFKRIDDSPSGSCLWDFIGKYHSHTAKIRDILFGPATIESVVYRFFSVGEDRNLIEYDLKNSGPYPFPGLQIMNTYQIECEAIPLCLAWYPKLGVEGFLMYSNSEVISGKEYKAGKYMVFATNKEIGLQILPFDGNPYKTLGMIGHPRKVSNICLSNDGNILFTFGHNDPCTLMWKIKCRSVDVLAHLGGKGLAPYYCLIDGGEKGWLINEMKHLFYYAQILHQGENVITPRLISDKVSTKEVPNLMRAVGYYPSNEEIEILMGEISYRDYAETGHLVEEIKFEDFVKFYINHRPAFGISLHQIQEAFQVFANSDQMPASQAENPALTREQFMRILLGEGPPEFSIQNGIPFGEPLKIQEAFAYMRFLVGFNENLDEIYNERNEKKSASIDFTFLPERISYKDFIADIMGIELPEETRADDD